MRLNKVIQAVMKVVKFKMILTVENAPIGAVQKTREIGAIDFMRVRRILGSTVETNNSRFMMIGANSVCNPHRARPQVARCPNRI